MSEFKPMSKIPRLSREIIITEKLDGTNASVDIQPWIGQEATWVVDGWAVRAASRSRWITPADDNHGFAAWVDAHVIELTTLGRGHHFGEWWGSNIQRGYGLMEKRFSLFNIGRWKDPKQPNGALLMPENGGDWCPVCCHVVPVLYRGPFIGVDLTLQELEACGSAAAPGFMDPEGIIVYHTASGHLYKKTIKGDDGKERTAAKERAPRAPKNKDGRRVAQAVIDFADRRRPK